MMALTLSVGFVVDDAIVMLENIVRHIELGKSLSPPPTTARGRSALRFLSMTVSLVAVFIPFLFMGGMLGRIFREFAVTICVAILVSGVVSITLSPMLCSMLLRPHTEKHGWLYRFTDRGFQALLRAYAWSLRGVLNHRFAMLVVFFGVIGATGYLYTLVPKGFIPNGDNDQMQINVQMAQGTSFYKAVELQQKVADVVRQDPDVETFMTNAGNGNNARFFTMLKTPRKVTAQQIAERLRPKFGRIAGVNVVTQIQPLSASAAAVSTPAAITTSRSKVQIRKSSTPAPVNSRTFLQLFPKCRTSTAISNYAARR